MDETSVLEHAAYCANRLAELLESRLRKYKETEDRKYLRYALSDIVVFIHTARLDAFVDVEEDGL